jgi:hypothetical protein
MKLLIVAFRLMTKEQVWRAKLTIFGKLRVVSARYPRITVPPHRMTENYVGPGYSRRLCFGVWAADTRAVLQ